MQECQDFRRQLPTSAFLGPDLSLPPPTPGQAVKKGLLLLRLTDPIPALNLSTQPESRRTKGMNDVLL